jgi:hypothetical protein
MLLIRTRALEAQWEIRQPFSIEGSDKPAFFVPVVQMRQFVGEDSRLN